MIEIQVTCTVCDGTGEEFNLHMGPDNMDIDYHPIKCQECLGCGWELIEVLQVVEV